MLEASSTIHLLDTFLACRLPMLATRPATWDSRSRGQGGRRQGQGPGAGAEQDAHLLGLCSLEELYSGVDEVDPVGAGRQEEEGGAGAGGQGRGQGDETADSGHSHLARW